MCVSVCVCECVSVCASMYACVCECVCIGVCMRVCLVFMCLLGPHALHCQVFRIADSECFKSIQELVTFYCNNPERFFRGMSKEDRKKHKLVPYQPLPKVQLNLDDDDAMSAAHSEI